MQLPSDRRTARMVFAASDGGNEYYHIMLDKRRLADHVTKKAAERIVKALNLLNDHEMAQENKRRERENRACCVLVVTKKEPLPKTKPVVVEPARIEPENNKLNKFGFTIVKD